MYRTTGYPFSWPASVPDLLVEGRPLSVYDLTGSGVGFNNVDIRMGDTDALFLGRGWSLPRRNRERTFREMSPEGAEVYVSLNKPAPYALALEGRAGDEAEVVLNGAMLGRVLLDDKGHGALSIAPLDVLPGVNQIVLRSGKEGLSISPITLTRPSEPTR